MQVQEVVADITHGVQVAMKLCTQALERYGRYDGANVSRAATQKKDRRKSQSDIDTLRWTASCQLTYTTIPMPADIDRRRVRSRLAGWQASRSQ